MFIATTQIETELSLTYTFKHFLVYFFRNKCYEKITLLQLHPLAKHTKLHSKFENHELPPSSLFLGAIMSTRVFSLLYLLPLGSKGNWRCSSIKRNYYIFNVCFLPDRVIYLLYFPTYTFKL